MRGGLGRGLQKVSGGDFHISYPGFCGVRQGVLIIFAFECGATLRFLSLFSDSTLSQVSPRRTSGSAKRIQSRGVMSACCGANSVLAKFLFCRMIWFIFALCQGHPIKSLPSKHSSAPAPNSQVEEVCVSGANKQASKHEGGRSQIEIPQRATMKALLLPLLLNTLLTEIPTSKH